MIPHNRPTLGGAEQAAAARVLSSGWVAQGREVENFENEICEFLGLPVGHAVAVSSGSAALYLALWVLGSEGKRIGLPVYSCSALTNAVGLVDGKAIYLDCSIASPNLDITAARFHDADVLIAPSMFGMPVEVDSHRRYTLIEDIAQSFGAVADGAPIGLRGDVGICSFYATKLITSGGQGGAIISRDKNLIDAVRDYREFDCRADHKLRFNFQMTDFQAAVGRIQLNRLPEFLEKREAIFYEYLNSGISLINCTNPTHKPVRYRAVIRTEESAKIIQALADKKIKSIIPIQRNELLDDATAYPVASDLTSTTVSLPIYPSLTTNDAKFIAQIVKSVL